MKVALRLAFLVGGLPTLPNSVRAEDFFFKDGDRSVGGNSRFTRDVLLHNPTAMTVDFGMNDHNDQIFRGIVLTGVPEWVYSVIPREQLEEKIKELINERLQKVSQLDSEVAETLKPKPYRFEIVRAN